MVDHKCDFTSAWPVGHPLPPVDPTKLRGPEVGTLMVYRPAGDSYRTNSVVRVVEQSYVWSPGECRHKGGYRNYDWSVVDFGDTRLVVNDTDLYPIEPGQQIESEGTQ